MEAGLISYADLKNGTINLYDLFIMNEMLEHKRLHEAELKREADRQRALRDGRH